MKIINVVDCNLHDVNENVISVIVDDMVCCERLYLILSQRRL